MANEDAYIGSPDNPRTTAVVGYITLIGWLIAYFALFPSNKTRLSSFHLRQALLIHIFSFILNVLYSFLPYSDAMVIIIAASGIALFILWLKALISALNGTTKPIPLIGSSAQSLFHKLGI